MKRYLSMLLVLAMLITSLPMAAIAEEAANDAAPAAQEQNEIGRAHV